MKHKKTMFFPVDIINKLQKKTSYGGLTDGAIVLLLEDLAFSIKRNILLEFENRYESFDCYNLCVEHKETLFGYFPETNTDESVPGFDLEKKRYIKDTLVGLSLKKPFCCFGTKKSFREKKIPKNTSQKTHQVIFKKGDLASIQKILESLAGLGYSKNNITSEPGDFSIRGDILDVFPHHFKNPFRLSINFNLIDSIALYDPSTQLVLKNMENLVLSDLKKTAEVVDMVGLIEHHPESLLLKMKKTKTGYIISPKKPKKHTNISLSDLSLKKGAKEKREELYIKSRSFKKTYYVGELKMDLLPYKPRVKTRGFLRSGFYSKDLSLLVVSENDVFSKQKQFGRWVPLSKDVQIGKNKSFLSQLSVGDYIVHRVFGLGLFKGILEKKGNQPESLEIEYKNNARVFVSLDQLFLVHRYIGSKQKPKLSTLGSKKWVAEIKKAKKSAENVALEILDVYSKKNNGRGFLYVKENDIDNELKNSFSFIETPDQTKAIRDVLKDMNKETPMDRLVCGDVGFGKTEVAIRAIFKSYLSDRLSIVLCPTTILANQHYITCKERLGSFGVSVDLLSRFQTQKKQKEILKKLENKKTDVLIGTHRLLSKDVCLPNLGILVIDEEHRFGVRHKEQIRSLRTGLDTLTLTATPIPRTLQQSLVGLRDISIMASPPRSRRPIYTSIRYFDWGLIITKITFELQRGGQVYFLHNDTKSIPLIVKKLQEHFKENVITGASGKMSSRNLENRVLSFFQGQVDVLVCTTIIESGLDVTNANTIIINDSQNFGLSQLYQIRGRVGRGKKQAHCLLLVPKKTLDRDAFMRLKSLEKNTALGSGYNISMNDLEIRGAGSVFGYKQSGHISSVGFELYCDFLNAELKKAKGFEKGKCAPPKIICARRAEISDKYIQNPSFRLDYYYRVSRCVSYDEVISIEKELLKVFGEPPEETTLLLNLSKVKAVFTETPVDKIEILKNCVSLSIGKNYSFFNYDSFFVNVGKYKNKNIKKHYFENTKEKNIKVSFILNNINKETSFLLSFVRLFDAQ